jgi:hypothetical protein
MAKITNYATLQSAVGTMLARTDAQANSDLFIQLVEAKLRRDPAVRKFVELDPYEISAEDTALPSEFGEVESIAYLVNDVYQGELNIVPSPGVLAHYANKGIADRPTHAAVLATVLRVAPVPDGTYTFRFGYWQKPAVLSGVATNWLLDEHPDVYFYGALCEAEPFLKNDERLPMWKTLYDQAVNAVRVHAKARTEGRMPERQSRTFG